MRPGRIELPSRIPQTPILSVKLWAQREYYTSRLVYLVSRGILLPSQRLALSTKESVGVSSGNFVEIILRILVFLAGSRTRRMTPGIDLTVLQITTS